MPAADGLIRRYYVSSLIIDFFHKPQALAGTLDDFQRLFPTFQRWSTIRYFTSTAGKFLKNTSRAGKFLKIRVQSRFYLKKLNWNSTTCTSIIPTINFQTSSSKKAPELVSASATYWHWNLAMVHWKLEPHRSRMANAVRLVCCEGRSTTEVNYIDNVCFWERHFRLIFLQNRIGRNQVAESYGIPPRTLRRYVSLSRRQKSRSSENVVFVFAFAVSSSALLEPFFVYRTPDKQLHQDANCCPFHRWWSPKNRRAALRDCSMEKIELLVVATLLLILRLQKVVESDGHLSRIEVACFKR